jgi:hypothetical protein
MELFVMLEVSVQGVGDTVLTNAGIRNLASTVEQAGK